MIRLLTDIGTGKISLSHAGIDAAPPGRAREHIRQIVVHSGLIPERNVDLSYFEAWLRKRLVGIDDPAVRRSLERFAQWHRPAAHRIGAHRRDPPAHRARAPR